jgi:hypothetical protein
LHHLLHLYKVNETNNQYQLDLIELMQYVLYYPESIQTKN